MKSGERRVVGLNVIGCQKKGMRFSCTGGELRPLQEYTDEESTIICVGEPHAFLELIVR